MQNGVTFWTEGGQTIGMGHLMRCINIAHALEAEQLPMHFLVNNERPVIERLNQEALFHIVYPINGRHAGRLTNGVVVIDTKKDVSAQVHALKDEGRKVVLIDNASTSEADTIIMPTPVCSNDCNAGLLSGASYLIIGENFRRERPDSALSHSRPLKVLVTMGGSDPNNLTEMVIKALWSVEEVELKVVIGPAFHLSDSMEEFIRRSGGRLSFLFNVKDMAAVMKDAHIAFTAVGTTVYELAYMGVPSVLIGNYTTDAADLAALEGLGIARSLGFFRDVEPHMIAETAESFRDDAAMWSAMSTKARGLTDGSGAARIASVISSLARQHN